MSSTLPHEITHVVLADQFADRIPLWANEGIASLSESPARRAAHDRVLAVARRRGRLYPLHQLVAMRIYPGNPRVFYAQSMALARDLLARGTPAMLIRFLRLTSRLPFAEALRQVYGG